MTSIALLFDHEQTIKKGAKRILFPLILRVLVLMSCEERQGKATRELRVLGLPIARL
jgi:hypothetical protein